MAPSKTRRKRGATYDTQLIQEGQHYSMIPRIPRASSSAIIPVSVKVKMPSWRGKKQNTFFAPQKNELVCAGKEKKKKNPSENHDLIFQEWCYRQKQLVSEELPMRD